LEGRFGEVKQVRSSRETLAAFEHKLHCDCRSSPVLDLCMTGRRTCDTSRSQQTAHRRPGATAVAELRQAAPGWADLLAECAGLALGYGEHQCDAARDRKITELCLAGGADRTLTEAWIEVGRHRASTAATLTHQTCVLAE